MRTTIAALFFAAATATAAAETPQLRCIAAADLTISTLPRVPGQLWWQAPIRSRTPDQASAVWMVVPARTMVDVYVSTVISGVEWNWVSAYYLDGFVSGWAQRTQLACR